MGKEDVNRKIWYFVHAKLDGTSKPQKHGRKHIRGSSQGKKQRSAKSIDFLYETKIMRNFP